MGTFRRLYFFVVAFIALNVAAVGAVNLLSTIVRPLVEPPAVLGDTRFLRDQIAFGISQVVVALPIWLVHWLVARRSARRDAEEARSLLWVFYLHAVLATAALVGLFQSVFLLRSLLSYPVGLGSPATLLAIIRALGWLTIYGAIWAYHRPTAASLDPTPGGRTIWRWYAYVLSGFGLGMLAYGAGNLIHHQLDYLLSHGQTLLGDQRAAFARHLTSHVPEAVVGALWWLFFWRRTAWPDAGARLRQVYLFLVLVAGLAGTLFGLSWVLYEILRLLFGYRAPAGVEQAHFLANALPFLFVGSALWLYHHEVIEAETPGERSRAATSGQVYFYFVAAAGLLLLSVGLANILHILLEFAFPVFPEIGAGTDWWRDELSRALVEAVVGLPLWWFHWHLMQYLVTANSRARQSLPRRLYVYGVLLVAVLAVLLFVGLALNELLRLLLGEPVSRRILGTIFEAVGFAAIAGSVVAYHWQVVRVDQAAAEPVAPRPARKRVLVLLTAGQRSVVSDLEAALGGPVEVWEQVFRDGEINGAPAPAPDAVQSLAEMVRQAPSDRVLVLLRPSGAEVYPFK